MVHQPDFLFEQFKLHANNGKAFMIAFGNFGLEDMQASVEHIAAISELDYVYANQAQLSKLMESFENALKPKGMIRKKTSRWLSALGREDNTLKDLSNEMLQHRQALRLESAKYRQLQLTMQTIQHNMQNAVNQITQLVTQQQANMLSQILSRLTERKTQVLTQLQLVNQALQAVDISLKQNKDIADSMTQAITSGVSAHHMHDLALKLKHYTSN